MLLENKNAITYRGGGSIGGPTARAFGREGATSLEFTTPSPMRTERQTAGIPTHAVSVQLTERDGGTRMEMQSRFESREGMEKLVNMGMVEGLQHAVSRMDALLAGRTASG